MTGTKFSWLYGCPFYAESSKFEQKMYIKYVWRHTNLAIVFDSEEPEADFFWHKRQWRRRVLKFWEQKNSGHMPPVPLGFTGLIRTTSTATVLKALGSRVKIVKLIHSEKAKKYDKISKLFLAQLSNFR